MSGDYRQLPDDLGLLRREFGAEDGSFLHRVRSDLYWDRAAFSRLEQAMRRLCPQQETQEQLDRWLVQGYWYLSDNVASHTSHPDFPRPEPGEYYQAAIKRLWDLQYWFAMGYSPYDPGYEWPNL